MKRKSKKGSSVTSSQHSLEGLVKRHPDGFGFFIPDNPEHPDVYLPKHTMTGVMTHDRVRITVEKEKSNYSSSTNEDRYRGEIIEILQRGTKTVVGTLSPLNEKFYLIKDEGKGWGEDLKIPIDEQSENLKTQKGHLVACEILNYPGEDKPFTGKITEILGDIADPFIDVRRVILTSGIPHEFSPKTLKEVEPLSANPTEADFKNRVDLRHLNIITIDGVTAKDFDDAVYTEMTATGYHLYVAIADVSHYVKPGTSVDDEAYERGTSVYFPNFVVPMLPEKLSNGLCSLNPHVPRLALVAEMNFDFTGVLTASKFYEAVIESKARVTYGEAQEVLDGETIEKLEHVKTTILRCADLAKVLMTKRYREGSLDLEIPDTELEIDASGVPIDIIKAERLFSHKLIEELMLIANVAVAKFFNDKELPALYRIHEPPKEEALTTLNKYMTNFGSRVNLSDESHLQKKLTKVLREFEGKPEAHVLNVLTLRSMSQAKYHMDNVGHFGLGFSHYTHFTSPIRRYPDLIVHRLIKSLVMPGSQYKNMDEDDLLTAGTMLSACEQRSAKAERQVQAIKKARFMEKFVGESFEGIVNSVTKFGIFVLLREYDIDGLIRLDDLGGDKWVFDEEHLRLVAKRSGFAYQIGDKVNITVAMCDHENGQINFVLTEFADQPSEAFLKASERTKGKTFALVGNKFSSGKGGRKDKERSRNKKREKDRDIDRRPEDKMSRSRNDEREFEQTKEKFGKSERRNRSSKKNRQQHKEDFASSKQQNKKQKVKEQTPSKPNFFTSKFGKDKSQSKNNKSETKHNRGQETKSFSTEPGKKSNKLGMMMSFPASPASTEAESTPTSSANKSSTPARRGEKKSLFDFLMQKGAIKDVSDKSKSANREDSKKHGAPENDSQRFRKARPKKSSRKNRSR